MIGITMKHIYDYPRPAVSVDIILFAEEKNELFVLLIQRDKTPFECMWAFPGGFVDMDETLEQAALRELKEETRIEGIELKQFKAYSAIDRDPRGRTISVVFTGKVSSTKIFMKAADDARSVSWFKISEIPELAFDHRKILEEAVNCLPGRSI